MNTNKTKLAKTRAKIIAELASLPSAIQGKICEDRRVLANGKTAVYHNLQYWADGRNHTIRIPSDKLADFQRAVKGDGLRSGRGGHLVQQAQARGAPHAHDEGTFCQRL